jgi:predicted ATPase/DNA-binding SARP family transcriptional activator
VLVRQVGRAVQPTGVDDRRDLVALSLVAVPLVLGIHPAILDRSAVDLLPFRFRRHAARRCRTPVRPRVDSPHVKVHLLGPLEVLDDRGQQIAVAGRRQRTLLSLLALRPRSVVPADRLIDDLWGERAPQQPANALQVVVFKLRRFVGAELIATQPLGYSLDVAPDDVDAHRFERLVRDGRAALSEGRAVTAVACFDEALGLWRDSALVELTDVPSAVAAASRWDGLRSSAAEDRFDALLAMGRDAELVADLSAAISAAPYSERLRGQLMLALYRSGRQAEALRAFSDARQVLADELGLEPGVELRRLETAILNQDAELELGPRARITSAERDRSSEAPDHTPTNLRPSMTTFRGRQREVAEVTDLLSEQRLVTLVGAGGSGKTRLAAEVAASLTGLHPDGVWFVALDSLAAGDDLVAAVAAALGLSTADTFGQPTLGGTSTLARIGDMLSDRSVLMVLDNCEHVIDLAAQLALDLLASSPGLRLLATSREALRVPGETVYTVPSLDVDDAVQLFLDRARSAASFVQPAAADRDVIAHLCQRLDGMPLAIELTAARTNAFTVAQLADRLDDRFRLLTGGARTALPRQQTLRAVTDWSYDLLFEDERTVFERLSVFAGSCSLEAAEAVCADEHLDAADIGPLIGRLVDKSLLCSDGWGRYKLLQTLAHYGRERLTDRGEIEVVRDRHADYYRRLTYSSFFDWRRPGGRSQVWWLARLTDEGDNLRAALEWSISQGDAQTAQLISGYAGWYWWHSGRADEGHRWSARAIECSRTTTAEIRAPAATWGAMLALEAGYGELAAADLAEATALSEQAGDQVMVGMAWMVASQLALFEGRLSDCIANLRRAQAAHASIGDRWSDSIAAGLSASILMLEGDPVGAELENIRSLEGLREVGDVCTLVISLDRLSRMRQASGRTDDAEAAVREAHEVSIEHGLRGWQATSASRLGAFAVMRDDLTAAGDLYRTSYTIARELALPVAQVIALDGLGLVDRRRGDFDQAAHHLAAARSLAQRCDTGASAVVTLVQLGYLAEEQGHVDQARQLHGEALDLARRLGDERGCVAAIEGLAAAVAADGDGEMAGLLLGHTARSRRSLAIELRGAERRDIERAERSARAAIGDAAFEAAGDDAREPDARAAVERALLSIAV